MIKKLHKIPDRVFFNSVFLIIVLLNLKYFFLPLQVIYTSLAIPFFAKNDCYAPVQKIVSATKQIKDFQDEGQIGFVSDVENAVVFDIADSIKSYYIAQYAIVPSILRNDAKPKYSIGVLSDRKNLPKGFLVEKEISQNLYVLKKDNE